MMRYLRVFGSRCACRYVDAVRGISFLRKKGEQVHNHDLFIAARTHLRRACAPRSPLSELNYINV